MNAEPSRTSRPRCAVVSTVRLTALVALATSVALIGPVHATAQTLVHQRVVVRVVDVSPSTPAPTQKPQPLSIDLSLTNTTDETLSAVKIEGVRGNPISTQAALDTSLTDPQPITNPQPITTKKPVTADLPARGTVTVRFTTTTGIPTTVGLCLCAQAAIYPLYFTAVTRDPQTGIDVPLGVTQTYVPSFFKAPAAVHVSWLWPLIDRPHRLSSEQIFTDDQLAASVSSGGRLDRALQVVERVGADVPLTLVIDPDLLDELEVMASGSYQVQSSGGTLVDGTGTAAAQAWLSRLRAVLDSDPLVGVDLTPYADPDVDALARAGLGWATDLPSPDMAQRVTAALSGRSYQSDIAWPAGETAHPGTLAALASNGTTTVVLNNATLPGGADAGSPPDALAPLDTASGPITAAVTSSDIETYVGPTVSIDGAGTTSLPELIAEVAIRAAQAPDQPHYVLITPPRYVDPSPAVAAQAITDTSIASWARPLSLREAVGGAVAPVDHGALQPRRTPASRLPRDSLRTARRVTTAVPALSSLLSPTHDADALLAELPVAVQRVTSSAWRTNAHAGIKFAKSLRAEVAQIKSSVHIVRPSSGTYTLASSNSFLPVTIANDLDYTVAVRLSVTTENGLPGFTAGDIGIQQVAAHSKRTVHIPARVDRTGRIQVQAVLLTPTRVALGPRVPLSIHSTALGAVGVIITIAAGVVLALALLRRLWRRWRHRSRGPTPRPGPAFDAEHVPDPLPEREPTP